MERGPRRKRKTEINRGYEKRRQNLAFLSHLAYMGGRERGVLDTPRVYVYVIDIGNIDKKGIINFLSIYRLPLKMEKNIPIILINKNYFIIRIA